MKLEGKEIADKIKKDLNKRIGNLISHGVTPKIAIITLGPETSWESYVSQKLKVAEELGIKAVLINLEDSDEDTLLKTISEIDSDPKYHGLIVQRPMPSSINKQKVIEAISAEKDIDGFRPDSKFEVPVWLAVKKLIETASPNFPLPTTNYIVLGKGETAGSPIVSGLRRMGIEAKVIDSKTEKPEKLLKKADVIISAVGKGRVVKPENLKKGVILIGVGTHSEDLPAGRQVAKKVIRGDYKAKEIEEIASSFTTTPGGVGPVNLSYLFTNLIDAAENLTQKGR